jgi:hypothetical protein
MLTAGRGRLLLLASRAISTRSAAGLPHGSFAADVAEARDHPDVFWARAAAQINWERKWDQVCAGTKSHPLWFHGGALNVAYAGRKKRKRKKKRKKNKKEGKRSVGSFLNIFSPGKVQCA